MIKKRGDWWILLILLAAPVMAGSSGYFREPMLALSICVSLIISGSLLEWKLNRRNASKLLEAAEDIYFVGYLCTMVSLTAILFGRYLTEDVTAPGALIKSAGPAIIPTVVGLFGMFLLRFASRSPRAIETDMPPTFDVKVEWTNEAQASFSDLTLCANEARGALAQFNEQTSRFLKAISGVETTLGRGDKAASAFAETVQRADLAVRQYAAALSERLQLKDANVAALTNLDQRAQQAQQTLALLAQETGGLCNTLRNLDSTTREGRDNMDEFVASVRQVQQVLDNFVALVTRRLDDEIATGREVDAP